ncbi:alpha/beta fold hydrolase [Nocardia huaxiensis]|uniref:Alpha/beta hydrolase n=1 Tax=Nocardia huaxiensis TaxID=2755382 RepID=A0A7D6ZD60_9NOCA|nr:alpha/beta hydrolase [Nocardia huaxiensis]QLY32648.1 alpha/beta hydrolase [Nocardia huaxiensis]UFS93619.1 alpha/beta hydrolase [Nocardia huaxiensis]
MTAVEFPEHNVGPKWKGKRIGYFRDNAGYKRYRSAYQEGFDLLPPPVESVDVPTRFGTVRAYRFGSGPGTPLVVLPGRQAATPMWADNLPGLIAVRPVITLDLLGEPGLSVQSAPLEGDADQAEWLAEALRVLEPGPVHVLGASIGGWSAVNLAVHHPDRVASLTVLDPPFVFGGISWKSIVVSLGAVLPGMPDKWRGKLLSWISGGVAAPENMPVGKLIASGMKDFASFLPMVKKPSAAQLSGIKAPLLAVFAGRSIIHNAKRMAKNARKLMPDAQVELWPDASHAITGEYPDQITARLRTFLSEIEPGGN